MQKVILVGNPNTGKTTLFNTLTKANEHASNWHGVTVAVKEKPFKVGQSSFMLCDLPGLYSLQGYSEEEKIACQFLEKNNKELVLCIVDANNLRRNLLLFMGLKRKTDNIILVINMAKEVKGLSAEKLEKELGVPCLLVDARSKKSLKPLKDKILQMSTKLKQPKPDFSQGFDIVSFEKKTRQDFEKIDNILHAVDYQTSKTYGISRLDKLFLNNFWSFFVFICIMGLVFYITFGTIGSFLSEFVSNCFEGLTSVLMLGLAKIIPSEVVLSFLQEAVIGGAVAVLGFVPQIMLLFTCLNFLEDVGYLSRVAFMFDSFFKKLGLTGRSAFSLIMGFGCTTSAVMTTRGLENKRLRQKTTILLPFMSCSAKLPIYAVICSAFFKEYKALMVFSLYLLSIVVMIVISLFFKDKQKSQTSFMLEMPKYRFPGIKKILTNAFESAKSFVVRVGGVILLCNVIIYMLFNFNFSLEYVGMGSTESVLYVLADKIKFIFTPLGLGSAYVVVAIISGFVAKEMVVSTLAILNSTTLVNLASSLTLTSSPINFTMAQAVSFVVFVLLYSPCISALASIKKEIGTKTMFLSLLLGLGSAYLVSFTLYQLITLICSGKWFLALGLLILIAIVLLVVLKYIKKKPKASVNACLKCGKCKGEVWK